MIDLTEAYRGMLLRDRHENDGLLHASSHLVGSLRHTQLEVAGAPMDERSITEMTTLRIGTRLHDDMHNELRRLGAPYMAEVDVTAWLPTGWTGTLDALIWDDEAKAFALRDWKTQKGEGMRFIAEGGAKLEHQWQASMYYHGAARMGLPLTDTVGIWYVPKNAARDASEPLLVEFEPIGRTKIQAEADFRAYRVREYLESLHFDPELWWSDDDADLHDWVTDELAPEQERVQTLYLDKKTDTWDVLLKPHWSAAYCPFDEVLCGCSTQGQTKIGMYDVDGVTYLPRKGYEEIEPTVQPEVEEED